MSGAREFTSCSLVSCPDPFGKSRRGLATVPYNGLSRAVCTVRANQIAEFSYVTLINRFVTIVGVVPFDKALIVSDVAERKMGSRKLLLKQKEVAEAFASWRDAFVSFPISYTSTFATDAFPQHRYC